MNTHKIICVHLVDDLALEDRAKLARKLQGPTKDHAIEYVRLNLAQSHDRQGDGPTRPLELFWHDLAVP